MIVVELSRRMFVELCTYINDKAKEDKTAMESQFSMTNEKSVAKTNFEVAQRLMKAILEDGE